MKQYFKDRDGLGATPMMTYKGNETYGTFLGGFCSCFATCFTSFYVLIVVFGFVTSSNYQQTTQTNYLSISEPPVYTVEANEFISAVQVLYWEVPGDYSSLTRNDLSVFDVQFEYFYPDPSDMMTQASKMVDAIPCREYLEKYAQDLNDEQLASLKLELNDQPQNWLCPDMSSFNLQDSQDGSQALHYFQTLISLTQTYKDLYNQDESGKEEVLAILDRSFVQAYFIAQYFTPSDYAAHGYNNFIRLYRKQTQFGQEAGIQDTSVELSMSQCSFYDSHLFDLSQFDLIWSGVDCSTYSVNNAESFSRILTNVENPIFKLQLSQGRSYEQVQWSVVSLDLVFGLIGGFIGLVYDFLGFSLGGYETFKFSTSLIGEIYSTTDRRRMKHGCEPTTEADASEDLHECLQSQGRYDYTYSEYLSTRILQSCCCCFKGRECYKRSTRRLKRHEKAQEQLASETDFFKFLKLLRVSNFISHVLLRKYQRNLIPYFKKYQLTELEGDKVTKALKKIFDTQILGSTAHQFIQGDDEDAQILLNKKLALIESVKEQFDVETSVNDLAILYEITGFQADCPESDQEFWANYANYKTLGATQMSINEDGEGDT